MNKVILLGRLTRDPEVRTTQSGKSVARIGLAVDRRNAKRRDVAPDAQTVDFINLVMWEQSADLAQRYLVKGSQILVEGRLQIRNYDDAQGQKRTIAEVVVERFDFVGSRPNSGSANTGDNYGSGFSRQQQPQPYQNPPSPFGQPEAADGGAGFASNYGQSFGGPSAADDDDVPF